MSERKKTSEIIIKNISNFSDEQINTIYNIFQNYIDNLEDYDTRQKKMLFIKNNLQYVNEENLKKFYQIIKEMINTSETETKYDKMYLVTLEIINKILIQMKKEQIDDLCYFIEIRRDELLKDDYAKIIYDNKEYIFKSGFNKHECKIYQTNVKNLHMSILKGMLKQVGYNLCSKNYKKMINKDLITYTTYTIKKNQ